jgi:tetratricopeptide (TPR) repeat protein
MSDRKKKQEFDLHHSMDKAELFYHKNSKIINAVCLFIIVAIGGYFGYKYLYMAPREKKAEEMVYKAQQYFEIDSFRLALNGDGNNYGYLQVINRYGNTKVGNLAKYSAGVCYVRMGDFEDGIRYLKQFDADDMVVQAMDYGIMGDAYMELGNTSEGIKYYEKAANYNPNDLISPLYLKRAALASEKAGDDQQAINLFKEIKQKYPTSAEGRDIDKYLARLGDIND